jgi:hypothetical protein
LTTPPFQYDLFTPFVAGRRYVQDNLDEGCWCPCCDQFAKRYKRKLNSGMARLLMETNNISRKLNGDGWIDLARMLNPRITYNREWGKLCYWGLLEAKDAPPTPSRLHEKYRITAAGVEFVLLQRKVPQFVRVYNNEVLGFEGKLIDIMDAIDNKFDYHEMMRQ